MTFEEEILNIPNVAMRLKTPNKEYAFHLMQELNSKKTDENIQWRVGRVISDRLVIDIDSHDQYNLSIAINTIVLPMHVIRTKNGYHLISKKALPENDIHRAIIQLISGCDPDGYDPKEWIIDFTIWREKNPYSLYGSPVRYMNQFKFFSGLYGARFDFDLIHAFQFLERGKFVVRVSKKSDDDTMMEENIDK